MRECGLKLFLINQVYMNNFVTPHAGVWIETILRKQPNFGRFVTPHAGVWIETHYITC